MNLSNSLLFSVSRERIDSGYTDPLMTQTVVYVYHHSADGASGYVINLPMTKAAVDEVNHELAFKGRYVNPNRLFVGGDRSLTQGYVLHSNDYSNEYTSNVNSAFSITQGVQVLDDIGMGRGPDNHQVNFGFLTWAPDELETEIEGGTLYNPSGRWISRPFEKKYMFNNNAWQEGVDAIAQDRAKEILGKF